MQSPPGPPRGWVSCSMACVRPWDKCRSTHDGSSRMSAHQGSMTSVSVQRCSGWRYTRVVIFQVIRELPRNVAAHARVESAQVNVTQSANELKIEVIDHGTGFDWQYDLFTDPPRGFGLFSVSD